MFGDLLIPSSVYEGEAHENVTVAFIWFILVMVVCGQLVSSAIQYTLQFVDNYLC